MKCGELEMKVERRRVLIVDPDSAAARKLCGLLVQEDVDVETAEGITQAVERINAAQFDCVIMDVELPEMKGYAAVSVLKAMDPKLQVIMTAADNTLELEAKVRKQDIFYYYIKSFDPAELQEAVRDAFKKTGKCEKAKAMDKPAKVLVVDDDPGFVKATRSVLESKGYVVESASNRAEAMEKIESVQPDLILLDVMMERLDDGFTICYKLKHDPELRKIPVLAISAVSEKTGLRLSPGTDGEQLEADAFMAKPVEPGVLLERVETLLKT